MLSLLNPSRAKQTRSKVQSPGESLPEAAVQSLLFLPSLNKQLSAKCACTQRGQHEDAGDTTHAEKVIPRGDRVLP